MGAKNAQMLLEILAKDKHFISAIESDTGKELLKGIVEEMHDGIEAIIEEKDTPEIRAKIRANRAILNKWTNTLSRYSRNLQKAMDKGT